MVTKLVYAGVDPDDFRVIPVRPDEQRLVERIVRTGVITRLRHVMFGDEEVIVFDYAIGDMIVATVA